MTLLVEFAQHNALGLAVATEWASLPGVDGWILWGGRDMGGRSSALFAVLAVGLWLLCFHAVLGRVQLVKCTVVLACVSFSQG